IGLCRTEHMFLAPDRLPIVRRMILADSVAEEVAALEELRQAQKQDFAEILRAMSGLPVTVRLLDPPLHEFLPRVDELEIRQATTGLSAEESKLMAAAHAWAEVNPMLGIRGVRLGVLKPGLYAMQVRALMEAADQVASEGFLPIIEVMIPLTVTRDELALARSWVEEVLVEHARQPKPKSESKAKKKRTARPHVTIGTMIETPRAALVAGELAEVSDFFSFGTNDLTQMTFGFSRDDVESRMMPAYLEAGLLKRNPFETMDQVGVGELVGMAVKRGRKAKRGLKMGVCGEHGGDPESIGLFYRVGLDYVSCSPYRIPIARLAAAQAIIGGSKTETK
ncbi:MAG: putative PEP-binding protein, partial [Actinomycetota bacterium]